MDHLQNKKECRHLKKDGIHDIFIKLYKLYELYKTCSQHDMSSGGFKDLPRRTASDKILRHKAFNIAENPKYDGYQHGIASMVYKFFDKKLSGIKNENISSKELAEELHKPIIRKFKKQIN